ncbi:MULTISPECIES: metallophosphoesterase family protein [Thermomonospora]|uniref:Icc-related predicted phosphoesterase n=1 Tax=Thermomonospora cellulosilytica TaxID=1411118 RepID=A0A7W3MWC0_9ACTN|nr:MULTISPECIES: metallophosphoesterase [Thermomonospora]MBA9003108.1 Icc-related predicted phosphoesterase [Thermomonospora cellulosilytica]
MIRVAAVGDIHVGVDTAGEYRRRARGLAEHADVLLVAGDLTRHGTLEEGRVAVEELKDAPVPVIAVLGNHDHHSDAQDEITKMLQDAGITVLEGDGTIVECNGTRLGVAGGKGFGGGFPGRSAGEFGEQVMKEFVRETREFSDRLRTALTELDEQGADVKIALTHYSPVKETLAGEPLEIYPFLGSYLMAEAIDEAGTDLAIHGHAHHGTEKGVTSNGTRVRNVALPVIKQAYAVYCLEPSMARA